MITLILEAVKEWVEELLNGFVKKGNAEDSKAITGRYNVLDYGLKGDGTTDNTVALQNMINSVPAGAIVFFPKGVYNISGEISIGKNVSIVGETIAIQRHHDASFNAPDSVINYVGENDNITLLKRSAYASINIKGITFYGNAFKTEVNTNDFVSLPYNYFRENVITQNVNALDLQTVQAPDIVENCIFIGFSGYAVAVNQHKYIKNCGFINCGIAIKVTFDSLVQNCWFCRCGSAVVTIPTSESVQFTTLSISDCWADQLTRHFIESTSPTTNTIITNNVWVDMVDGSAFYFPNGILYKSDINGHFGRIGMAYAGINDSDRTSETSKMSDLVYARRISNCVFNVGLGNETMEVGRNPSAKCMSRLLTVTEWIISDTIIICDYERARLFGENTTPSNVKAILKDGIYMLHKGNSDYRYGIGRGNGSPINKRFAPDSDYLYIDKTTGDIYISTSADDKTAWKLIERGNATDPTDIDFSDIEGV